ncbi:MAG TPA: lipid-A-disaccharide synthase, partial [Candidatus Wallbacteria bacterium]|nr:lipid-A-disaccharide synthase [Candidatus Wallbacteria bacterium]
MENNNKKIMIIAGEISGDLYGYPLVSEIYSSAPGVEISGVGGPKMKSTGMKIFYDSSSWGTIGMIEAVKKLPHLYFVLCDIYKKLAQLKPDLLVLIDYPGFNMRLCRYAKKLGIPTLYYFPPSKWTYNPVDVSDAAHNITKVAA